MSRRIIDVTLLRSLGACRAHVDLFHATWPAGLEVPTSEEGIAEIAVQASTVGLDLQWAAEAMLSRRGFRAYSEAIALASKAYDEAIALASKAYDEAIAPASKAYSEAIAPASKAYSEAIALASKAYSEAIAPASKAYDKVRATEILRQLMLDAQAERAR